jgi:hypothetical protein
MNPRSLVRAVLALLLLCIGGLAAAAGANAQSTAATVRGSVRDDAGQPVAGATVTAVETDAGYRRSAVSGADGSYTLAGLQPGSYQFTVSGMGRQTQSRSVRVLIGQTLSMDFVMAAQALVLEGVTVTAGVAVDTRTSEVATNITTEQMESLPQPDRNFLNFAGLAPGITVARSEDNKQISAGGLPANKINVFIDGTSYKNDVLEGGVHGQDASRGNPFPQIAVREFRVITQNFKAEHQRAASAVVTATTRSGTNQFEANGFVLGQNADLVAANPGAQLDCGRRREGDPNATCTLHPEYERLQLGLSVGGPLIRDRLHYFLGYEGNYQDRQAIVTLGPQGTGANRARFAEYEGTFDQPFRSNLLFGKLSFQPAQNQTLDLSYSGRFESDKRGFGGTTSFESAENVAIGYNVVTLSHTLSRGDWLNQAHVSAQRSTWNPTVVNDNLEIGLQYDDIIRIGARSTEQRFVQDRLAFRNDATYTGLRWLGEHVVKGGVNVDFLNYEVAKRFNGNPTFFFRPSNLDVPYRVEYGEGDPGMSENNVQFGAFVQTDWAPTSRLELNLGIRWDAETNLFNNEWVTPDSIRQQITAWNVPDSIRAVTGSDFPANYLTRGREDRPLFLGAFQPRAGFSYDVLGTGNTVVHGGFGLYYDREIWNRLLDERFRLSWRTRNLEFTTTGEAGKVPWDPSYLSVAGLQGLITQGNYGRTGELFLLNNDTRPSRTHQFNLGVRQTVGPVVAGVAYRGVRGYNIFSWYCATPQPEHGYCGGFGGLQGLAQNYGIIASSDAGRTWYDALDLTASKPFTETSRWGFTLSYTMADASRKGMDFFTLDFPMVSPEDWPRVDQPIETHRLVASGIVGLPFDVRLSSVVQLGSGVRYNTRDEIRGWGPRRVQVGWAEGEGEGFRQVDLRLEKGLRVPGSRARAGLTVEVINALDDANYREYEALSRFDNGQANATFGQPLWWTADPGRRVQLGVDFGF